MNQEPTIGRIVHYVLNPYTGEHRPAIIVGAYGNNIVNLQVFTDGDNDADLSNSGTFWASSVEQSEEFKERNTWHWPERTDDI